MPICLSLRLNAQAILELLMFYDKISLFKTIVFDHLPFPPSQCPGNPRKYMEFENINRKPQRFGTIQDKAIIRLVVQQNP